MLNKYIGIFFAVCLVAHSESKPMEDVVIGLITEFKDRMCYPQNDLGLPQLHPLTIANLPFDLSMDMAHLKGHLKDFVVQGLGDLNLIEDEVSVGLSGIKAGVRFPKISVTGYLKAEGDIGELPIDGPGGNINIVVDNLYIFLQINPKPSGTNLALDLAELKVTISELDADLKGLSNYEEVDRFFSSVVSQIVPDLLVEILGDEKQAAPIRKTLSDLLNDKLPPLKLSDLLPILTGTKDPFGPFPEEERCSVKARPEVHLVH